MQEAERHEMCDNTIEELLHLRFIDPQWHVILGEREGSVRGQVEVGRERGDLEKVDTGEQEGTVAASKRITAHPSFISGTGSVWGRQSPLEPSAGLPSTEPPTSTLHCLQTLTTHRPTWGVAFYNLRCASNDAPRMAHCTNEYHSLLGNHTLKFILF